MARKSQSKWGRLRREAARARKEHAVPGVLVGVLHKGRARIAGYGVTNHEHPLKVTKSTLFQIGSITKTYTGTLAMMLAEDGQLDLDAPIRTYLPGFRVHDAEASEKATIQHLLTHTSGWFGDFFLDTGPGDDAAEKYVAGMPELVQVAPLGKHFSYNNAGFSLLGRVIEAVTEKPFHNALREMVLEPLGLHHTFLDPGEVITHRFASGHFGRRVARPWPLPRAAHPAGGIICSMSDLLAYASFHLGDESGPDGERLLAAESLARMQAPAVPVWNQEHRGLSWAIDDSHGTRLVMHGGGTMGQISMLVLAPEHHFAVAVFTNADAGRQVTVAVTRAAIKAYLQVEIVDPEPVKASEETLAAYAGLYTQPMADIQLGVLAGRLIGQGVWKLGFPDMDLPPAPPPPPMTLGLIEPDRLMILDGPMKSTKIDAVRRGDGSIGWLRVGGRLYRAG